MNKDIEQQPSPAYLEDELLEQIRSLPPRSVTHRKRREEEKELKKRRFGKESNLYDIDDINLDEQDKQVEAEGGEQEGQEEHPRRPRKRSSFLLIQVILFTFLALILTFLLFWYWQQQKNITTVPISDPFDLFVEQGGLQPILTPEELEGDMEAPAQDKDGEDRQQEKKDEQDLATGEVPPDDLEKDEDQRETTDLDEQDSSVKEREIIATHTIQSGEALYGISVKYYGTGDYADALAEFNGITDKRKIRSGTVLQIPEMP